MKAGSVLASCLIGLSLLGSDLPAQAQGGQISVQGPALVGNGLPNGIGTSLGRLFVKIKGFNRDTSAVDPGVSLEIPLTSSTISVEPTTCAAADGDCATPGTGTAEVNGHPTALARGFMRLKLGGALYLPYDLPRMSAGSSFEVALEGALNVGTSARENAECSLRLSVGTPRLLRRWGAHSTTDPDRSFEDNTGTGFLVSDVLAYTFPGLLTGEVVRNDGDAVLVAFRAAEISAGATVPGFELTVEPDVEAARAAGLPPGAFFVVETNYSGFPSRSGVFPGAVTNDVEVRVTAEPLEALFARGDCNGDGDAVHGLADAIFLVQFNFRGGPEPPCLVACDADGDGLVRGLISDALFLLNHAFSQGDPPPPPFPLCGFASPGDPAVLGCVTPPPCGDV